MNFYSVICVDAKGVESRLKVGETYSVHNISGNRVMIKEICGWFYKDRFTEIDGNKIEETFLIAKFPHRSIADSLILAFQKEFTDYHLLVMEHDGTIEVHSKELFGVATTAFVKGFITGIP